MKKQNKLLILVVFAIFVMSFGCISAADNNSTISDNPDNDIQSQVATVNQSSNHNTLSSINGSTIKTDAHVTDNSSSNLINAINNNNNTVIYLDNQTFNLDSIINLNYKNLTLYGGHAIGDGQTSTISTTNIFNATNSSITLININLDSPNSLGCGIFDYRNTTLINCSISLSYLSSDNADFSIMDNCIVKNTVIFIQGNKYALVKNCTFENSSIISLNNENATITNSTFYNGVNKTSCIENTKVDNCTFYNNTGACIKLNRLTGACIWATGNNSFTNCNFSNNLGELGTIYASNPNNYFENCTFTNNSALYGGAIYLADSFISFYDDNLTINNCSFINNSAKIAGGAISVAGNLTLNNSVFSNNSAGVCGGAIVIGNSTNNAINNCNFTDNNASDYGNDIYYYDGNIVLNNTQINDLYNAKNNSLPIYGKVNNPDYIIYLDNGTYGYCLEERMPYPAYADFVYGDIYSMFNNTNLVINTLTYENVGDYIKYIIYKYDILPRKTGQTPNVTAINYAIWTFTDNNYTNIEQIDGAYIKNIYLNYIKIGKDRSGIIGISRDILMNNPILGNEPEDYDALASAVKDIVNQTLNAVNGGEIIPDQYVVVDENGTATLYNFSSIFSNRYQNFITVKTSNFTAVYDMNITKITNTPVVYKGNDASFDIIVANNGTMTLYNVSIIEDSFDDLTYKSWKAVTGNWTYNFINNKHTWTLNNPLLVNQSARITVIFSTNNSTVGDKINTVIATSNNTDNKTANNTTKVIENNTTNPNNPENNTPNKPTPASPDNHSNITPKEAVKTTPDTGYPIVVLIIALITILASGVRKK